MEYQRAKDWHRGFMSKVNAGTEEASWDRWKTEFLRTFLDDKVADRAFREWFDCKQVGKENVTHYTERYEAAVLHVQESQTTPMDNWDERKKETFVEGLVPALRSHVASAKCNTLEEAVHYALKLERWQHREEEPAQRPRPKRVGAVQVQEESKKEAARPADPRACYTCGNTGHISRFCPQKPARGSGKCYACDGTGHS